MMATTASYAPRSTFGPNAVPWKKEENHVEKAERILNTRAARAADGRELLSDPTGTVRRPRELIAFMASADVLDVATAEDGQPGKMSLSMGLQRLQYDPATQTATHTAFALPTREEPRPPRTTWALDHAQEDHLELMEAQRKASQFFPVHHECEGAVLYRRDNRLA